MKNYKSCLLKYRGEAKYHLISRDRAAYLFRAARSRRQKNITPLCIHTGGSTRRIEDAECLITTTK